MTSFQNQLNTQVGPCRGYFPRWYYDASMQMCLQFIYGGCRGNSNNFEDYEDCMRLCETHTNDVVDDGAEAAALTGGKTEMVGQSDQGEEDVMLVRRAQKRF